MNYAHDWIAYACGLGLATLVAAKLDSFMVWFVSLTM